MGKSVTPALVNLEKIKRCLALLVAQHATDATNKQSNLLVMLRELRRVRVLPLVLAEDADDEMLNLRAVFQSKEPRSGLHTSEIDPGSAMSYSEVSSVAGYANQLSSIRPGVNDDTAFRTMLSATGQHTGGSGMDTTVSSTTQAVVYGTDVNIAKILDRFKRFIVSFCPADVSNEACLMTGATVDPARPLYMQRLEDLAMSGQSNLDVNLEHVQSFRQDLHDQIVTFPKEVIPACDAALHALFVERFRDTQLERPLQTRPFNCSRSRLLRNLDPDDLDQLVSVRGLVIRTSAIIPEMMRAEFKCFICGACAGSVCERGRIQEPDACARCHSRHSSQIQHNRCIFVDKQLVKLQESPEDMPASQTPHTVNLYSHEDLVDKVQPGDRVTVTGIYRAVPLKTNNRMRTLKAIYKTYVDVLHFKVERGDRERDPMEMPSQVQSQRGGDRFLTEERITAIHALSEKPDLYERLATAIAPSIYENEDVKKGILLQLFSGSRKDFSDRGRGHFRAEINMLLCGDPGTSKSQLLQYVFNLAPRSQYTSGKGSSAVGLTAYVTKDPETRQLSLQTGALVLADNGVCCIDEFDKMSDSTRSVLHEVMEQQTLSIAKAGILCQLNARTSILAAANPVGSKWDAHKTIIDNIQVCLSRVNNSDHSSGDSSVGRAEDCSNETYDKRLARHLVSLYFKPAEQVNSAAAETGNSDVMQDMEILKDYISYAKANINPTLSDEAGEYLVREYVSMRQLGAKKGNISAYPRQLESLIRLSEAHAKMRLSNTVTADDCREARRLQLEALKQTAIDPVTGMFDMNILTTGMSSASRKKREEMGIAILALLEERPRVMTFNYNKLLEDLRAHSDKMITRESFEDGLIYLRSSNRIDWAGLTIRKH
ncbi:DNA replication licensing factor, mcm4 component [Cichlidogyrus casuarinus]|uniref:DNA replication licensing factor MCM4 n=1 Tax=Cichlidogyrus casuarinus TaxID=1844966 RepID=A0ABD2Q530_9PLAT